VRYYAGTLRHTPKLANVLSAIQNDMLHEFIDNAIVSFCNRFRSCVAVTDGH